MSRLRLNSVWRDQYNPLPGLTLARLVAMENAAQRGQHADLQWFYHHMEQTDVTVQSAIARRLAFIDGLDWEIKTVEGSDPVLAQEQTELLRYAYERITNLKQAAHALGLAIFRGYSHLEKIRTGYGSLVSKLDVVPQWFWIYDTKAKSWRVNLKANSYAPKGEVILRKDFVIFESQPVNRSIGRHFFSKQLAFADWDIALETASIPSIFVTGPPGTTPEKEAEYKELAVAICSNLRGYLPPESKVTTFDAAQRGKYPYQERIDYCDRQIVMAATGGLLSMLTESGSGTLAGGAHADGLMELARSDAARITETFQRDLDREWLAEFFPRQPQAAYFAFDIPQRTSFDSIMAAVGNLNWAGFRIQQAQLEEKTGLRLEQIPQPNQQ